MELILQDLLIKISAALNADVEQNIGTLYMSGHTLRMLVAFFGYVATQDTSGVIDGTQGGTLFTMPVVINQALPNYTFDTVAPGGGGG